MGPTKARKLFASTEICRAEKIRGLPVAEVRGEETCLP